jgi:hypothetical protein
MRVVMEFTMGPLQGRRFQLTRNQRLVVGNTAQADVVVRGDNSLAARHLALETDQAVCRLVDLSGKAATLLNGQAVESAVLRSGDLVQAGRSQFKVLVEGEDPIAVQQQGSAVVRPVPKPVKKDRGGAYQSIACDTGLTRYEASCSAIEPAELAELLAAEFPPYVLVDNRRAGIAALSNLPTPQYLFNWLGDAAPAMSPLVLSPNEVPLADLLPQAWQKDALACFFANNSSVDAVQALRSSARVSQDRVMGICWPTILAYLLSHFRPDAVNRLIEPFRCILVEDPQVPDRWQLYAHESLDTFLSAYGLNAAAPAN